MGEHGFLSGTIERAAARLRFDRNELSGSFGDIGTDFPLIVGMIIAADLDVASTLTMFGLMQILTGVTYGLPMPAQPLKAMAVMVIAQQAGSDLLYGGGLAVGIIMLLLSATGLIDLIAKVVPKVVIRGIQFGLGLQLASLALRDYVLSEGVAGYALAASAFAVTVLLIGNRRFPPAPFIILGGFVVAFAFRVDFDALTRGLGFEHPTLHVPTGQDVWLGLLLLGLPQIPLSLGNSILATQQIAKDLFPQRRLSVRKISFTYAMMNVINPFFSGIPTCHGSGGMAGHHAFGGRTGGSVVIYGLLYLVLGLFCAGSFEQVVHLFPKPILGVILLFEALALLALARDMMHSAAKVSLVFAIGLLAVNLPYGYLVALVAGTLLAYLSERGATSLISERR